MGRSFPPPPPDAGALLTQAGVKPGDLVAVAIAPGVGVGLAAGGSSMAIPASVVDPVVVIASVERGLGPRWVWWSNESAAAGVRAGVRPARCWDVAAVHRLLYGGWSAEPPRVWAREHGLASETIPDGGTLDLFTQADADEGDPHEPVRDDGHLRPDWVNGGWSADPARLERWALLALEVAQRQRQRLAELSDRPHAIATARSESAAELLCVELAVDGLPMDRGVAEELLGEFIGPRPRDETEAADQRRHRDREVLRHAPADADFDLRSPAQVRSLLRHIGIEVPDTRAWRLKAMRDAHPLVEALLAWRKAERIATTYGYAWLDEHLEADGRLRGAWSATDGAAGRMTASAGLHNMPADMRAAVRAEPGHVFIRADLGQIEPRVLAAVSGDDALARATFEADMYARVAHELGVDRATAKVAMLGAMYGQTTGHGAQAGRGLRCAYPGAMAFLEHADRAAQVGQDLRTYGGRLIRMGGPPTGGPSDRDARKRAAARGRYGRNAVVQGAAAELFKVWAATVRARAEPMSARIVLCLHDELLVHAPIGQADEVARLVEDALQEAAHRWAPGSAVRFVAAVSVIERWSDAKG